LDNLHGQSNRARDASAWKHLFLWVLQGAASHLTPQPHVIKNHLTLE